MRAEDRYTIFLSPGEFFWIVGHLGFKNLPFLGTFIRSQSPEQVKNTIQHGFETLLQRNLAHRLSPSAVEVDPSLASLVEMIAKPDYTNLIGSMRKGEPPIQVFHYYSKGQSVTVIFKDRFFHFTLFREENVLQRSLLTWMGIGGQITERSEPIQLPVLNISDLLTKCWDKPEGTLEILQGSDLSNEEAERQAELISQITLYSTLNRIGMQDGRFTKQRQITLLGNSASLWGIDTKENLTTSLELPLISATNAALMVMRYLRPELPLDGEEDQMID